MEPFSSYAPMFIEGTNEIIKHVLATYALWFIVAESKLPLWGDLRDSLMSKSETFARLMLCPICSGFWASLALVILTLVLPSSWGCPQPVDAIVKVLYGTAGVYLIETLVTRATTK